MLRPSKSYTLHVLKTSFDMAKTESGVIYFKLIINKILNLRKWSRNDFRPL